MYTHISQQLASGIVNNNRYPYRRPDNSAIVKFSLSNNREHGRDDPAIYPINSRQSKSNNKQSGWDNPATYVDFSNLTNKITEE